MTKTKALGAVVILFAAIAAPAFARPGRRIMAEPMIDGATEQLMSGPSMPPQKCQRAGI